MSFRLHPFKKQSQTILFWYIYTLAVIFNFHSLLVGYTNSSFLEQSTSPTTVSMLFTIGSALSVVGFLFTPALLKKSGNYLFTIALISIEIVALLVMATSHTPLIIFAAFLFFISINPIIYFCIDVFSETLIGENESSTGSKRGLTLTLMSAASVISPLAIAIIAKDDSESLFKIYQVAAFFGLTFLIIVILFFRGFKDPIYHSLNLKQTLDKVLGSKPIRLISFVNFSLQVFFTWTVIYVPLYMTKELGFNWTETGSIIAVGLMAYVFFEYPLGVIADKYTGEKEMLAVGILILIQTIASIIFIPPSITIWMLVMFINRIGASLVEVGTESYFFKHTTGSDANTISFFRLLRPLAMLFGSLMGTVALVFLPFSLAFGVLALSLIPSLFAINQLVDTK